MTDINLAIQHWAALATEEERKAFLGLTHPKVAKARATLYRKTAQALEIQRDTGTAVCACCLKPFSEHPHG